MRTKLATATRWAAQRPRRDQQGIALQTVIVIVVMLVIAGGVSGVLLSRGGDVISDLESADVSGNEINTVDECTDAFRSLTGAAGTAGAADIGTGSTDTPAAGWNASQCTIVDDQRKTGNSFSRRACELYRGPTGARGVYVDGTQAVNVSSHCTIA